MNQYNALQENKKKIIVCYVLLMLGIGVWQLADWDFGKEDPLWHLVFYFVVMPVLSFLLGVLAGDERNAWRIPFGSAYLSALIYIFMANGGLSFDTGALQLCFPSFIGALAGVIVCRVRMWWRRSK